MKRLDGDGFERASRFLHTEARPLERAMFAYRLENGPSQSVLAELTRFANDDGGFGHALEPDVRTPSSSALATALALKVLEELDVSATHPQVRGAVDWLVSTYDAEAKVWRVVPPDANDHPHAPWWHDENGSLAQMFDGFRVIPRALIVGLLHRFGTHRPTEWLDGITESTVSCVEGLEVLGEGGGSDLEYVVHLARTATVPESFRARLSARIRAAIPSSVERDPAKWSSYCVTPLRAVPTPDSIGADLIASELAANLDRLIGRQRPDGAWDPTWEYPYAEGMAPARTEWRGIVTLEALTTLRAFGRIDGVR